MGNRLAGKMCTELQEYDPSLDKQIPEDDELDWAEVLKAHKNTTDVKMKSPRQQGGGFVDMAFDRYFGQKESDGKEHVANGVGIAFFNEDNPKRYMKYIGQWKEGLFSGRGILFCWDGSSYDGQWVEGKK